MCSNRQTLYVSNAVTGRAGGRCDGCRRRRIIRVSKPSKIASHYLNALLSLLRAAAFFSTIVTVAGITAEDALIVQLNDTQGYDFENSTGHILVCSKPGAGQVTLTFANLGNATGYVQMNASYIAVR